MNPNAKIMFVYNADSGLFNNLADTAHKALSPETYQCSLCALTHGLATKKAEWRRFLKTLPEQVEFLHRDEFEKQHPSTTHSFPAVLYSNKGKTTPLLHAKELDSFNTLEELVQELRVQLQTVREVD